MDRRVDALAVGVNGVRCRDADAHRLAEAVAQLSTHAGERPKLAAAAQALMGRTYSLKNTRGLLDVVAYSARDRAERAGGPK